MKVGKKLLSVFLAVIMIMSSMSVCFGTFSFTAGAISADDDVKYVEELKKSFEEEALKTVFANYSTYFANSDTGVSTGTGSNNQYTNTVTVTLKTYDQYVAFAKLLDNLYGSILQASSFKSFGTFQEDGETRACCDAATVLSDINKALGFSTSSNEYKFLSTFFKNGKYYHGSYDRVEFGKTLSMGSPSAKNVPSLLTDKVVIVANDDIYKGYLANLADNGKKYTDVDDSINAGNTYSLTMHRAVWESKDSHRSSGWGIKTYYYYAYYHSIIDTGSSGSTTQNAPSVSKTIKGIDDQLDTFAAKLDEVKNLTYSDMLAKLANGTIESYLNTFNSAYKTTVEYCGDTTETRQAYIDENDTAAGTYNYINVTTADSVFNKLFSNRLSEITNFYNLYKSAMASDKYMDYANEWKAFAEANPNYGVFSYPSFDATYDQMVTDYQDFLVIYNNVQAGSQQFVDYVKNNGIISLDYYTNFTDNVDVYNLKATAAAAKAAYESYSAMMDTMTTEEKSAAYSVINGFINTINSHTTQEKNAIFAPNPGSNADYKNLIDLEDELYCEINENVLFFAEKAYLDYTGNSTTSIIDLIAQAKEKQEGLTNLYNDMVAQNGTARADALLGTVRTAASDMIDDLYALLAARLTAEVAHGWEIFVDLGQPSTVEDINTYLQMQKAITTIETKIYDYLVEQGKTDLLSADTVSHYNTLIKGAIYTSYTAYATTCGFNDYEQSYMTYENRDVYATEEKHDEVKTETYAVTEQNLLNTIEALDTIITSDTVSNLLGSLINTDGSPLDLGAMLTDLVKGALFTDDFINTVMQLLYPLVVNEFDKVFATLPRTV